MNEPAYSVVEGNGLVQWKIHFRNNKVTRSPDHEKVKVIILGFVQQLYFSLSLIFISTIYSECS